MSEIMRWKLKGFIPGVEGVSKALFQPWVVQAEDFDRVTAERDAALGREAALREDNSIQVARRESALNRCEELQQRLTAADERADVLEGLLRRVVDSSVLSFEQDAPEELESIEADICAALKPVGADKDEHVCPGCGTKGWTAGCKECVPY